MTPLAYSFTRSANDPRRRAATGRPRWASCARELTPSYRVEAVDTAGHWDAVYLAGGRHPDRPRLVPAGRLPAERAALQLARPRAPTSRWLRRMGVRYVVLTTRRPTTARAARRGCSRRGHSGLERVFRSATTSIYAVPSPRPIVTGPARAQVLALRTSSIAFRVSRPGTYRVAIRYTPYWSGRRRLHRARPRAACSTSRPVAPGSSGCGSPSLRASRSRRWRARTGHARPPTRALRLPLRRIARVRRPASILSHRSSSVTSGSRLASSRANSRARPRRCARRARRRRPAATRRRAPTRPRPRSRPAPR